MEVLDRNETIIWPTIKETKVHAVCTACMGVWADFLSWANAYGERVIALEEAEAIVVLGCQVTDLAVLNDLRTLERLMEEYPGRQFYVGGCLAYRCDIPLPAGVRRLSHQRCDYQWLHNRNLCEFAPPFWVKDWNIYGGPGHLFRDNYPLRIGVGCSGACAYCMIRHVRGAPYELDPQRCVMEFLNFPDALLIADNPGESLLREWLEIVHIYRKPIALRNVEPQVAMAILPMIENAAELGLIAALHVPIQSNDPETLACMGRRVKETLAFLREVDGLRRRIPIVATNIIVDYKDHPNPRGLDELFTHVNWNPYWDRKWDRQQAERRFEHYFPWTAFGGPCGQG